MHHISAIIPRNLLLIVGLVVCVTRLSTTATCSAFEPYPDKADMLIVIAHPDDETVFGGMIADYAACRNMKVVLVCLTSGEWGNGLPHPVEEGEPCDCSYDDSDYPCFEKIPADQMTYPSYYREGEMARAAITYGMKYKPIMPRLKDMSSLQPWGSPDPAFDLWGGKEKVVAFVTKQVRRFRPDVIVTMPWNGYNGNPIHLGAVHSATLAWKAAADPHRFPDQLSEYATWQTQKLYLNVAKEESYQQTHPHDWTGDCAGRPGTAQILGARGSACHESQAMKEECPATTDFYLKESTVGPDVISRQNLFENATPTPQPNLLQDNPKG